jgi:hypothetical protein
MDRVELVKKLASIADIPFSEGEVFLEMFVRKISDDLLPGQQMDIPEVGKAKLVQEEETFSVEFTSPEGDGLRFYLPEERNFISYPRYNISIGKPVLPINSKTGIISFVFHPNESLHLLETKAEKVFSSISDFEEDVLEITTDVLEDEAAYLQQEDDISFSELYSVDKEDDDIFNELTDSTLEEINEIIFDDEDDSPVIEADTSILEEPEIEVDDEIDTAGEIPEASIDDLTGDIFADDLSLQEEEIAEEEITDEIVLEETKLPQEYSEEIVTEASAPDIIQEEENISLEKITEEVIVDEIVLEETKLPEEFFETTAPDIIQQEENISLEEITEIEEPVTYSEEVNIEPLTPAETIQEPEEEVILSPADELSDDEISDIIGKYGMLDEFIIDSGIPGSEIPSEEEITPPGVEDTTVEKEIPLPEETFSAELVLPETEPDVEEEFQDIKISSIDEELPSELMDIPGDDDIVHEFDNELEISAEEFPPDPQIPEIPSEEIPEEIPSEDIPAEEDIPSEDIPAEIPPEEENPVKEEVKLEETETSFGSLAEKVTEEKVEAALPIPETAQPEIKPEIEQPDKSYQRVKSLTREFFNLSDVEQEERILTWEFGGGSDQTDKDIKSATKDFEEIAQESEGFTFVKSKKSTYEWAPGTLPEIDLTPTAEGDIEEIDLKIEDDIFASGPVTEPEIKPAKEVLRKYRSEKAREQKRERRRTPADEEKTEYRREQKNRTPFIIVVSILAFLGLVVFAYYTFYKGTMFTEGSVSNPLIIERNDRVPVMISTVPVENTVPENQQIESSLTTSTPEVVNEPAPSETGTMLKITDGIYRMGNAYYAQVSSWQTKSKADKEAERYRQLGYRSEIENSYLKSGLWYRILVGEFESEEAAQNFLKKY